MNTIDSVEEVKEYLKRLEAGAQIAVAGIQYEDATVCPGLATSVFLQGCDIRCPGCFNKETWGCHGAGQWHQNTLLAAIQASPIVRTVCWLGGEPTLQCENLRQTVGMLAHHRYTQILFTGRTKEEILKRCVPCSSFEWLIGSMNYVKAGPYIEKLKDPKLKYRGSSNQRIYKVSVEDKELHRGVSLEDVTDTWENITYDLV